MNKKALFFWLALPLFIWWFYPLWFGVNALIFNILLLIISWGFIIPKKEEKGIRISRMVFSASMLVVGASVAWYGDVLSVLMTLVLYALAPFFLFQSSPKIVLSWIYSILGFFVSLGSFQEIFKFNQTNVDNKEIKVLAYVLLPLLVVFIFGVIYASINQDFALLFSNIRFPELDVQFFVLLVIGSFYLIFFFFYRSPEKYDIVFHKVSISDDFEQNIIHHKKNSDIWLNSGVIMFGLLSSLLILLLIYDIQYIACFKKLNIQHDFSGDVHANVQAVIGSIVLAIMVIMAYFFGGWNGHNKLKYLKYGAFTWISLNAILIFTTALKNYAYIDWMGLTEKRLGVYIFLLLCVIGLIFTGLKVKKDKSNFYLLRNMAWTFLLAGVLASPINWTAIITSYNLSVMQNNKEFLLDYNLQLMRSNSYNYHLMKDYMKDKKAPEEMFSFRYKQDWRSKNGYFWWISK